MHELSIADSILDLIERQIGGIQALAQVELCIGPLSGVSADSLEFCFTTVAKERGFGEPVLHIERTKVQIHCEGCQMDYNVDDLMFPCPHCSSWKRVILSGDELHLLNTSLIEDSYV